MDELFHVGLPHDKSTVGRGSGRYPWGSGKNPRAARKVMKETQKVVVRADKARMESIKKAREAKYNKEAYEEAKRKAIESGNPEQIVKFIDNMTTSELANADTRVRLIQNIKRASAYEQEKKSAINKIDKVLGDNGLRKINNWTGNILTSSDYIDRIIRLYEGTNIKNISQPGSKKK